MTQPYKLIIEVSGGLVRSVNGDKLPVEIEVIVRDFDNIEAGDDDPVDPDYIPELYYW